HTAMDPTGALSTDLDRETILCLTEYAKQCEWKGRNSCLDQTYKNDDLAFTKFAKHQVEASFGFSESLFTIFKTAPGDYSIIIAPLVVGNSNIHYFSWMDLFYEGAAV